MVRQTILKIEHPKDAEVVKERMASALRRAANEIFRGIALDFLKEIKISDRWLK